MTDLARFLEFYRSLGIELKAEQVGAGFEVMLEAGSHEKFNGYTCFYSVVLFDFEEKFVSQGFWE